MRLGKTTKTIEDLKQSDDTCLIVKSKKEKEKLVRRFNLSPDVSDRILVQEIERIAYYESWRSAIPS